MIWERQVNWSMQQKYRWQSTTLSLWRNLKIQLWYLHKYKQGSHCIKNAEKYIVLKNFILEP